MHEWVWKLPLAPCTSTLQVRKTTVRDRVPCLDKAAPTRGSLKERWGKQWSDGLSCLDKAVLALRGRGGTNICVVEKPTHLPAVEHGGFSLWCVGVVPY